MAPAEPYGERGLVRAIGVRGLTASIVNVTVGAGIFVLPALVARDLGTAAPLAYLACAFAMMLVATSFAVAGSRVSLTGGIYAYVEVAFGPLVGFVTGFLVWLSSLLAAASVATALAASVALSVPGVSTGPGRTLLLGVVYGSFAALNVRGVSVGTRLVEMMTLAKLVPLIVLVSAGLSWVQPADLAVSWAPPAQIGAAAITLIFAFVGIEIALVPSGEIREPARTVPRALLLGLGIVTLLYVAVQLVAHAVLGAELARFTDAPLAEVASRALGGWGRSLVLLGGSISMLGFLSGDALATPRALFAFARDRLLPTPLARVHPRFHTPWIAILVHATIAWITASMGTFSVLIVLSNVAILSSYLLCCAAAIALQRKHVSTGGIPFSVPGGPVVPLAACIVLVWLLSHATVREFGVTGAAVAFALLLYGVRSLRRSC